MFCLYKNVAWMPVDIFSVNACTKAPGFFSVSPFVVQQTAQRFSVERQKKTIVSFLF